LSKLFKEPLVQFLLIGACIYAAYALLGAPDDAAAEQTVYISEARIDGLSIAWEKRWNRPPTEDELVGLVRAYLREDILYREAVAMGLDEDDHIIRRRLAQKLEFLTNDLVQLQEPAEGELEAFFAANIEQFQSPDLITFVTVFFNPDKRGDATLDDAEATLQQLQVAGEPDPATLEAGDRLLLNNFYANATEFDIRRSMGSGFAETVMALDPGAWHGPVLSGFGTHLVYVFEFVQAPPPELGDVRDAVMPEWQRIETEQFNADFLDSLKARYEVVIEAPDEFAESVLRSDSDAIKVAIPDGEPAA
jgi:peptidyl-prolyl cis-trans isomerase C